MSDFRTAPVRTLRVGPQAWRALGQYESQQPRPRQAAACLPGVLETSNEGDFWCGHCGADLGVRDCAGRCCKQTFSDIFEDDPCDVGGEVDHGCCYHDEEAPSAPEATENGGKA